ncbi:uncharacterized protein LOC113290370 [Papaver somniferum]|uniref:uncharacterized protein LOC113290370 n=1 Tax=Papaver somniferum TaxID=3469 RepID=UPI000E702813|nr:uncharacterized protein LOC113290370 [Papaver somniferum]
MEPSMNPHNIHVQPPAITQGHDTTNIYHQHISMMESDDSTATNSAPMNDCVRDSSQEGFQCSVHGKSNNIINVLASLHPAKQNVLISFMYVSTYSDIKKIQWDVMSIISDNIMQPWIVIGDLNVHLHTLDSSTSVSQDDKFVQQKINDCGLMDLGYIGRDFTWSSNKIGTVISISRIDMALGNQQWCFHFPNARLYHLVQAGSDHYPIMLQTDKTTENLWRPFKFFAMWLKHAGFKNQLKISWNTNTRGSPGHILIEKHIYTRKRLSYWNKIDFGDIDSNINALQDQLLRLQNEPVSITRHNCLSDTNKQLEMWFDIKTEFYKQKSGDKFIVDMDNNSRYFHTLANRRMFRKNIGCLYDVHGPDGFQDGFYHVNWDIVGNDIVQDVQSFFISGYMPREFNKTYLSLIPKADNANYPADFRPISLCRAIQDNIIIAHEIIHTMKHKEEISILLNGSPNSAYSPTRGLRQGDPLSSYLFIIAIDYLSRLLVNATTNHVITGVKAARNTPAITHLRFADDILIFTKADRHNTTGILNTLNQFGNISGK